ncbi:MAG: transposase [Natronomonas sp.]|nr:transposase [Natronomonas sp.]MDR9381502.1 transposase [Natronomonas sp.]MDR9429777.1 transposase [Natronomonas sp.]
MIDGTHIAAWANTRDEIENGKLEGASWGKHEGSFYGCKMFLVVDAASELPVAITMETGKRNDTVAFEPLIEEFEQRYDTDDLQAALADAGFDSQDSREFCQEKVDCPLLTAIDPRRSSSLKKIRDDIKQLFEEREDEFDSPYEALEELSQQILADYDVEAGNVEETYIF